jgi:glycosyltransferase involved in cell wall biosynthesis
MLYDKFVLVPSKERIRAILGQTAHEVELFKSWGMPEDRVHLVPLCVDLTEYHNLPKPGEFREKHPDFGESDQIYLFLGRIHKYKGLDILIRAFKEAFDGEAHALVIAGRDEEGHTEMLRRLATTMEIDKKVFFPGTLYGLEKLQAFVDSHAFTITPSIYEETSLAALEAAASGLPVITSVQSDIPWLQDYGAGYISSLNLGYISGNLRRISKIRGDMRIQMGQNAKKLIRDRFSSVQVARQL